MHKVDLTEHEEFNYIKFQFCEIFQCYVLKLLMSFTIILRPHA